MTRTAQPDDLTFKLASSVAAVASNAAAASNARNLRQQLDQIGLAEQSSTATAHEPRQLASGTDEDRGDGSTRHARRGFTATRTRAAVSIAAPMQGIIAGTDDGMPVLNGTQQLK